MKRRKVRHHLNDFEVITRFAEDLSNRWNNVTVSEQNKNSFTGMQKLLKSMRTFLQNERKDYESQYAELTKRDKYSPAYVQRQKKQIDQKWQNAKETIVSGTKNDIRQMIADKYKKLDSMLSEAPTPQQYDLLRAIQMRGRNISRGELMKLLPYFYTNYVSMKILESIALSAGHNIMIPISGDVMDMYGELDRAGQYLLRAADELAKSGKPDMAYRAFFFDNADNPGNCDFIYQRFIDMFDKPTQLQTYTISTALSEAEQAKINQMFRDLDGLDPTNAADNITILRGTQQIMKDHADDVELMKRSQYAKYVREVEEINSINSKYAEAVANGQDEETAE